MPVMKKRQTQMQRTGLGNRITGVARFGLNASENAFRFGRSAFKAGKTGLDFGRRVMRPREAKEMEEKKSQVVSEFDTRSPTVEEELAVMRERKLDRLLERFTPEIAEALGELIEQAMERQIDGHSMHKLLEKFFSEHYPNSDSANLRRWIKVLMLVTHPDYAKDLKVE